MPERFFFAERLRSLDFSPSALNLRPPTSALGLKFKLRKASVISSCLFYGSRQVPTR